MVDFNHQIESCHEKTTLKPYGTILDSVFKRNAVSPKTNSPDLGSKSESILNDTLDQHFRIRSVFRRYNEANRFRCANNTTVP